MQATKMPSFGLITQKRNVHRLKEEFECAWLIKNFRNFSFEPDQIGLWKTSPRFSTGPNHEYEWEFYLYCAGWNAESFDYVGLEILLVNMEYYDDLPFMISAYIIDEDGAHCAKKTAILANDKLYLTFRTLISREELLKNPRLLPDGNLKIGCTIFSNATHTRMDMSHTVCPQSDTLGKIFKFMKFADFHLVVGGKVFKVHRAILAARSVIFEKTFDTDAVEVELHDIEPMIMDKLLRYIYKEELEDIEAMADKLLIAARRYQIDDLKQICEHIIAARLTMQNIYDTLRLAEENNSSILQKKSLEFFYRHSEELSTMEDFTSELQLLSRSLMIEIIRALIQKG